MSSTTDETTALLKNSRMPREVKKSLAEQLRTGHGHCNNNNNSNNNATATAATDEKIGEGSELSYGSAVSTNENLGNDVAPVISSSSQQQQVHSHLSSKSASTPNSSIASNLIISSTNNLEDFDDLEEALKKTDLMTRTIEDCVLSCSKCDLELVTVPPHENLFCDCYRQIFSAKHLSDSDDDDEHDHHGEQQTATAAAASSSSTHSSKHQQQQRGKKRALFYCSSCEFLVCKKCLPRRRGRDFYAILDNPTDETEIYEKYREKAENLYQVYASLRSQTGFFLGSSRPFLSGDLFSPTTTNKSNAASETLSDGKKREELTENIKKQLKEVHSAYFVLASKTYKPIFDESGEIRVLEILQQEQISVREHALSFLMWSSLMITAAVLLTMTFMISFKLDEDADFSWVYVFCPIYIYLFFLLVLAAFCFNGIKKIFENVFNGFVFVVASISLPTWLILLTLKLDASEAKNHNQTFVEERLLTDPDSYIITCIPGFLFFIVYAALYVKVTIVRFVDLFAFAGCDSDDNNNDNDSNFSFRGCCSLFLLLGFSVPIAVAPLAFLVFVVLKLDHVYPFAIWPWYVIFIPIYTSSGVSFLSVIFSLCQCNFIRQQQQQKRMFLFDTKRFADVSLALTVAYETLEQDYFASALKSVWIELKREEKLRNDHKKNVKARKAHILENSSSTTDMIDEDVAVRQQRDSNNSGGSGSGSGSGRRKHNNSHESASDPLLRDRKRRSAEGRNTTSSGGASGSTASSTKSSGGGGGDGSRNIRTRLNNSDNSCKSNTKKSNATSNSSRSSSNTNVVGNNNNNNSNNEEEQPEEIEEENFCSSVFWSCCRCCFRFVGSHFESVQILYLILKDCAISCFAVFLALKKDGDNNFSTIPQWKYREISIPLFVLFGIATIVLLIFEVFIYRAFSKKNKEEVINFVRDEILGERK